MKSLCVALILTLTTEKPMTKKNQNIERLSFSVQEAAAAIGVSSRTVHDFVKDGTIAHFRMGTRVLIPADALRVFIESRTQAQKP